MKQIVFILATLVGVGLAAGHSQVTDASSGTEGKPCALLVFHQELRNALSASDVARVSLLVQYPLRVNDGGGSFYIHDAASLQGHFREIFTSEVQKAILGQDLDTEYCGAHTVVYVVGEAGANLYERGYRIGYITVSPKNRAPKAFAGRVEFVCRTDTSRIVVDSQGDGSHRLRAWNTGTSLTHKPDIEIAGGTKRIDGTGACTHAEWSFESGESKFSLSQVGCYPDSNQPPAGAQGQFGKNTGQKDESWSWCY